MREEGQDYTKDIAKEGDIVRIIIKIDEEYDADIFLLVEDINGIDSIVDRKLYLRFKATVVLSNYYEWEIGSTAFGWPYWNSQQNHVRSIKLFKKVEDN